MMANLIVIAACLCGGLVYQWGFSRHGGRLASTADRVRMIEPVVAASVLGRVVIWFSLPALTFLSIHELKVASLAPIAMPWLVFWLGAGLFAALGRAWRWPRARVACVVLCAAFGNTSFVGYPLIEALFGSKGGTGPMSLAVLIDQAGCFPALALGGVAVLAVARGQRLRVGDVLRRVLLFPPFLALLAAVALRPLDFPEPVRKALERIALTLVPLALLSVGLQIRPNAKLARRHAKALAAGLAYKLVLAPAIVWELWHAASGAEPLDIQVTVAQAAMAPMITGAIMASEAALEPELAGLFVGVGIPLSLLTVPAWVWVLRR